MQTHTRHIANYWETAELWNEGVNRLDRVRIPDTLAMIPSDVQSVLEVGCGNGRVANMLSGHYRVTGTDISHRALSHVVKRKVQSSSSWLPFKDHSFDLIICCDVLEHLPTDVLRHAVAELQRVSTRYLLIGVPHREQTADAHARCLDCGSINHIYGHLRSFTTKSLNELFPSCDVVATRFTGERRPYINPLLLACRQRLARCYWKGDPYVRCLKCGSDNFQHGATHLFSKMIAKASLLANAALDAMVPPRWKPYEEVVSLFRLSN
jgi:SAM-dependent methyltransferase